MNIKKSSLVALLAFAGPVASTNAQCTSGQFDCDPLYDAIITGRDCATYYAGCCIAASWAYRCSPGGVQRYTTIKSTASGDLCIGIDVNGEIVGYSCF